MDETVPLKIVILGGSFAGLSVVHHILQNSLPELTANKNFSYQVIVISPSTHIYWNISAPRGLVSASLIPHSGSFKPISKAVERYPADLCQFIQGAVTGIDTRNRTVSLACPADKDSSDDKPTNVNEGAFYGQPTELKTLQYHALVIATGTTAHSPLLSLRGPHFNTIKSIDAFHSQLPAAQTVVISGGGPSGVETAGQIAYWYNQPQGPHINHQPFLKSLRPRSILTVIEFRRIKLVPRPKKVILLSGSNRLLPKLEEVLGHKAHKQLASLGVEIVLNTRVQQASVVGATGKTTLRLSDGSALTCDLYVPCTGVSPNTQYLPQESPLLRDGFIATTPALRVEIPDDLMPLSSPTEPRADPAGGDGDKDTITSPTAPATPDSPEAFGTASVAKYARVYAIGDCASYSANCILDIYAAIPVLIQNLVNDLLAYQLACENPYGGNVGAISDLGRQDAAYIKDERDSQVCPIGYRKPGGVGVVFGIKLPSLMVFLAKGRGYKVSAAKTVVEKGLSPY